MTRWLHSRRGVIEGEPAGISDDKTWVHIRLTADSPRMSTRARGRGPVDVAGETITVRRSFLQVIP